MENTNLNLIADIKLEAAQESGKLPTFTMRAYSGGKMKPKGFAHPVVIDLDSPDITFRQSVPVRYNHSPDKNVGHTDFIKVQDHKIYAGGTVSRKTAEAEDITQAGKAGYPWQASVGMHQLKGTLVPEGESKKVNGEVHEGPFYHITAGVIHEISVVELGADDDTETKIAAKKHETSEEDTHMSKDIEGTPKQEATQKKEAPDVILAARQEESRKGEIERLAERSLNAGADIDQVEALLNNALKDRTVTASSFEHDLILVSRPSARPVSGRGSVDARTIEASLALATGLNDAEKVYGADTLNAAQDAFPHNLTLGELLFLQAQRHGFSGSTRDVKGLLQAAFALPSRSLNASFSTLDIGGILSNVANKFALQGFFAVENTWDMISSKRNARDFKQMSSFRLTGSGDYEKVPAGGELKHGKLGEEKYTNQVDTYGKMLAITRQDIINDDMDSLSAVPRRLGRDGAVKLNQVFWNEFVDNTEPFWSADNNNYIEGAGTALGVDGLTEADNEFREQVDADGNPMLLNPRILLVPSALRIQGMQLMNSTEIRGGTGKQPTNNPHAGAYQLASSQYLSTDSKLAFYLLADPNDLSTIEVAFLNGQRTPTVESAEADFHTLGIQMRSYFDFGVNKQDPRASVKSKGEA